MINVSYISKNHSSLYLAINNRDLQHLYELVDIEYKNKKPAGYWENKDNCHKAALQCKTVAEFSKKYNQGYVISRSKNWLHDIGKHFLKPIKKPPGYWNDKARCLEIALQCTSLSQFARTSASKAAKKYGWHDEISAHIPRVKYTAGYWTKEKCHKIALKCKTYREFRKQIPAFSAAYRNNWLVEITSHIQRDKKPHGYWKIKENCKCAAAECKSLKVFNKKYRAAVKQSKIYGWFDEITSHF